MRLIHAPSEFRAVAATASNRSHATRIAIGASAIVLTTIPFVGSTAIAQDVALVEQQREIRVEGRNGELQVAESDEAGDFVRELAGTQAAVQQLSSLQPESLVFMSFAGAFGGPESVARSRLVSVFDVVTDDTNALCGFDYALLRGGDIAPTSMLATMRVERFTADAVWVPLATFGESIADSDRESAAGTVAGIVVPLSIGRHRVTIEVEATSDAVETAEVAANASANIAFVAGPAICGDPKLGSCFDPRDVPGCSDADCCAIVCGVDSFCCETRWDDLCADIALDRCDGCSESTESCLVPHESVSCADPICCSIVCSADGFCCDTEWDEACVEQARVLCLQCPADGTEDLNGDGVVSGPDLTIVLDGWGTSGCSDINNDGLTDGQDLLAVIASWTPI